MKEYHTLLCCAVHAEIDSATSQHSTVSAADCDFHAQPSFTQPLPGQFNADSVFPELNYGFFNFNPGWLEAHVSAPAMIKLFM